MGGKTVIAIAIIIVTGVVYYYEQIREQKTEVPFASVVVAAVDIPANTVVTGDMVAIDRRYAPDLVKEGKQLVSSPDKVVGKRTLAPVFKNEPVHTGRLVEDERYMDGRKGTLFAIPVAKEDRVLGILKGSYVDLWIQPNQAGLESGRVPEKVFEKLEVISVRDESPSSDRAARDGTYPANIIVMLSDGEIIRLLGIEQHLYRFRVALHGDNRHYDIISDIHQIGDENGEGGGEQ